MNAGDLTTQQGQAISAISMRQARGELSRTEAKVAIDAVANWSQAQNLVAEIGYQIERDLCAGAAFWQGGGDDLSEMLFDRGWKWAWSKATYYFAMTAPDGSGITYIEGDVDLGDER